MWKRRTFLGALLASTAPTAAWAGPTPTLGRAYVVVIDPGHGGDNLGCEAFDGLQHEKEVTLQMARELRSELRRRLPHATIVLTREKDETLSLAKRVAIANAAEADVFISLHANASPTRTQQGYETYVLDAKASSLEAARTARRENGDSADEPAAEADRPQASKMLRELELSAHRTSAVRLAQRIQVQQKDRFPTRLDRGVKQAPFDVLMGARMPAVLFEAGFLDHPKESALLRDGREPIVTALSHALVGFYREQARLR